MIQRIQTVYMLIVSAAVAAMLFLPLAVFRDYDGELTLRAFSLASVDGGVVFSTIYLGALLALACLLPLITIFLFRRRLLQIRLCVVEIVLLVGVLVVEWVYYYLGGRMFSSLPHPEDLFWRTPQLAAALPIVGLLFAYLAARAVLRDELMVRAADRIR